VPGSAPSFPVWRGALALLLLVLAAAPARAQKRYDPGASDSEIRIGNFMPYSGPFADSGAVGRAEAAYFKMVNEGGGVNGRRISFLSLDSGPAAPTPLDLARRLVEEEPVLFLAGTFGGRANRMIRPYLNEAKVPQLFVASNDDLFADPEHYPWTMGFAPSKHTEGAVYGKYVLERKADARIAVLHADDDEGAEFLAGVREGLGAKADALIVAEAGFSYKDIKSIDPLVAGFKAAGANVFMNLASGRFASEGIRAAADLGWRPVQFLPNAALSVQAFLEPAGLSHASGLICNAKSKGWSDRRSRGDQAVQMFLAWLRKYNPEASDRDAQNVYGYEVAQLVVEVLKRCGDQLTRANVLEQATHLDLQLGMMLPGIRVRTSPTDYRPVKDLYLVRFDGHDWQPLQGGL